MSLQPDNTPDKDASTQGGERTRTSEEEAQFREGLAGLAAYHAAGYPAADGDSMAVESSNLPAADIRYEDPPGPDASAEEQQNWGLRMLAARDQLSYSLDSDTSQDEPDSASEGD